MIHVDTNNTDHNQPIPADLTKTRSIHDSVNIFAMEKILASLVNYPAHTSLIFNYGSTSDPPSPPHDSLAEILTPKGNPKPRKNPPNPVTYVPADPYSDPS